MRTLARLPEVAADLQRLDLGTPREIVGTFVGSASRLAMATRETTRSPTIGRAGVRRAVADSQGDALPAAVVDLAGLREWCPTCFVARHAGARRCRSRPVSGAARARVRRQARIERRHALAAGGYQGKADRSVRGRSYLAEVLPDSAEVHNTLGIALAQRGRIDGAIDEFRAALRLEPESSQTHWHLGAALASTGARVEAIEHLRRAVELDRETKTRGTIWKRSSQVEKWKVEKWRSKFQVRCHLRTFSFSTFPLSTCLA
jgi:hypothetical protein